MSVKQIPQTSYYRLIFLLIGLSFWLSSFSKSYENSIKPLIFNSEIEFNMFAKNYMEDSLKQKNAPKLNIGFHEVLWVIGHPFVAKKSFVLSKISMQITDSIKKDSILTDGQGGPLDAFRHGIWMKLLTDEIGMRKAIKLGQAHEKSNFRNFKKGRPFSSYHNSLMDSINNLNAVEIPTLGLKRAEIIQTVIDSVKAGYFVIIRKNEAGESLDRYGQIVKREKNLWKWNECLIKSNGEIVIWEREKSDRLPEG